MIRSAKTIAGNLARAADRAARGSARIAAVEAETVAAVAGGEVGCAAEAP